MNKADRKIIDYLTTEKWEVDYHDASPPSVGRGGRTSCVCMTCQRELRVFMDGSRELCPICEELDYLQVKAEKEEGRLNLPSPPSLADRTDALLRGFELLLGHHQCPYNLFCQLKSQLKIHLNNVPGEDVWLGRVKSLLASPLAKYLRCEAPPKPDVEFRVSGRVWKWLRNRLRVFNRRNTHLWFSWFQIKRCALECSPDFVEQTYLDHQESLTSPDQGDDLAIAKIFKDKTFLRVLERAARGVEKHFSKGPKWEETTPSKSACYERSRSKGGQQRELRSLAHLSVSDRGTELERMTVIPHINTKDGCLHHQVVEIRTTYGRDEWENLSSLEPDMVRPSAKVQIILEPLKGRVISKGPAHLYSRMRPLQKAMHKTLRRMPCFRLIGRTLSPTDLIDLVTEKNRTDDAGWLSIDYKAATDGLSWKYSSRILFYLIQYLDPKVREEAFLCLGPHDLYYPDSEGVGLDLRHFGGTQVSGQLMGSILSFPVLCLANLGVYLSNMAIKQDNWSTKDRLSTVLINGDDMLYVGSQTDYTRHSELSGSVGLKMSVGKAYWHPVYANINSESFHYNIKVVDSTPYKIPFLNTGLFFGAHKVQRSEKLDLCEQELTLLSTLNLILDGTLPGRQADVLSRFIALHADEIWRETLFNLSSEDLLSLRVKSKQHRNLFLPFELGGMGVLPPDGYKFRTNSIQKRLATLFVDRYPRLVLAGPPPYPEGYIVPKVEVYQNRPWFKRLRAPDLDTPIFKEGLGGQKCMRNKLIRFLSAGYVRVASSAGEMIL